MKKNAECLSINFWSVHLMLLLFIGLSSNISAQGGVVKLSPEYKLAKSTELKGHLYSDDSGHYMYFNKRSGRKITLMLEKYDSEFKQVFSKDFLSNKKYISSLGLKYFDNKFAWMLREKNKKGKYYEYFLTPIDMQGKSSKPVSIARFPYDKKRDMPNDFWKISEDTSKMLFIAESDNDDKKENYESFISIIDSEFNEVYSKRVKLPFSEKRTEVLSWEVTNEGDVFFLAKVYDDNKRKEKKGRGKKRKPAYQIKLYKVNETADGAEDFKLKLGNDFIRGMGLKVDKSNNLACVGFYSDSHSGPLQGVFYMKVNSTDGEIAFADKRKFTNREIESFGTKNTSKDKKSKEKGLDDEFRFQKIYYKDNGEIMATAEENYTYVIQNRNAKGMVTNSTTYYVSNSIVTVNISQDGIVDKISMIPKKQKTTNTMFSYHTTLVTDNQVYFIYNDDEDNLKKNITDPNKIKQISSAKECVAVISVIGDDGGLDRKALFTKKEAKTLLRPEMSNQINKSQIFFFSLRAKFLGKNTLRFGTISLE